MEADGNQITTWLFEPDGFAPLAKLSEREQLSILTDHLGTPVEAYDAEGASRFSRSLGIYGQTVTAENEERVPFRYPGQYYDSEVGLCYNRFRYYDPGEGCYISRDPIGLAGGNPTLYGYVGDVNSSIDILGLKSKPCHTFKSRLKRTEKWVDSLSGKSPAEVDGTLRSQGFTRSIHRQGNRPNATPHVRYTRSAKQGKNQTVLDYHPGTNALHETPYWKVYAGRPGSEILQGRIAPEGFKKYDQIKREPLFINKVLVNG